MDIFEFKKEIDDMSEGELRATARDFRQKHNEQVEEANETESTMTEYKEELEEAQAEADAALEYFAERAAEVKDMDEEMLADRFSADELRTMVEDAEEAGEFSTDAPDDDPEDDPADDPAFDDKPGKAPVSEETTDFNEERAARVLGEAALIPESN